MKLSEVLDVLLKAEDEALEMRTLAEQEAKAMLQKAHDRFSQDQEARLNAAREEARVQVDSAKQSVDMEVQHIAEMAQRSRERMQAHFDEKVPGLIAQLARDVAERYAEQGRS